MKIAKAPLRISLLGGGSDFPEFFSRNEGAVLGGTIDKYVYVSVLEMSKVAEFRYRFTYRNIEETNSKHEIRHPVIRTLLHQYPNIQSLNIATFSDLPGNSGLGSSSAFAVAAISAFKAFCGDVLNPLEIAKASIQLEREILGESGGWQDQFHSTYGGFNLLNFKKSGDVEVQNILNDEEIENLNNSVCLVKVGGARNSSFIQDRMRNEINLSKLDASLILQRELAFEGRKILNSTRSWYNRLSELSRLVNENWRIKKSFGSFDDSESDTLINLGLRHGALAGKLCGAGDSGYILFLCHQEQLEEFKKKFTSYQIQPFKFINTGIHIYDI